jgi:hypothetical protein
VLHGRRVRRSVPQQVWQALAQRLRRAGLAVAPGDTASELQHHARRLTEAEQQALAALLQQWQRLQYAPQGGDDAAWRSLWRQVRAFRPAKVGRKR